MMRWFCLSYCVCFGKCWSRISWRANNDMFWFPCYIYMIWMFWTTRFFVAYLQLNELSHLLERRTSSFSLLLKTDSILRLLSGLEISCDKRNVFILLMSAFEIYILGSWNVWEPFAFFCISDRFSYCHVCRTWVRGLNFCHH